MIIKSATRLRKLGEPFISVPWKNTLNCAAYSNTKNCSSENKETQDDISKKSNNWLNKIPFKSTQVIVGSSIVLALGVSKALYGVTSSFLALTPAGSLYYGFIGGMATMGMAAGFSYIGERSFRLNPNHAIRSAMQVISKNKGVQEALGGSMTIGPIKTYKSIASSIGVVNGKPGWVSPRIEVVFQLHGKKGDGLVSVVYTKKGLFQEKCEFIEIEVEGGNGKHPYLLVGEADDFTVRSDVKRHANVLLKALRIGK